MAASITGSSETDPDTNNNSASAAPVNRPPIADAGSDQTVSIAALVALNGNSSTDPDGDTLAFQWTLLQRPPNSIATLTAAGTASPSFTADRAGEYVAEVVVTDAHGSASTDTVTITAQGVNHPAVITSSPPISGVAGQQYHTR